MFKNVSKYVLLLFLSLSSSATINIIPNQSVKVAGDVTLDFWQKWGSGIKYFFSLVDVKKITKLIVDYIEDPDVVEFISFVFSPKLLDTVKLLGTLDEFKEAVEFLEAKGYDVQSLIDFIVSNLINTQDRNVGPSKRIVKGMAGLLEDLINILPLEEMNGFIKDKLETSPEFADLFQAITSEEFLDILRRMSANPKFGDIVGIFEGYGFDFKYVCYIVKKIFGDYYEGVFVTYVPNSE